MLLMFLLGVPMWLTVPVYFMVGTMWAFFRLPYTIARKARKYEKWRAQFTKGKTLEITSEGHGQHKKEPGVFYEYFRYFVRARDEAMGGYPLRSVMVRFILSLAFWPIGMIDAVLEGVWKWVARICRFVWRVLNNLTEYLDRAFSYLCRKLAQFYRAIHQLVQNIWQHVFRPVVLWGYRHAQGVYRRIVLRANREAIADLAALEKSKHKEI